MDKPIDIIKSLGVKIENDRDQSFSIRAVWRGGDNRHAVSVFKSNGAWKDFVTGDTGNFYSLVSRITGRKLNKDEIEKIKNMDFSVNNSQEEEMEKIEKTYNDECLIRLPPDYSFWRKRNISDKTLKFFEIGTSHSGPLLSRSVFPIRRADKRLHGFVGRDLLNYEDSNRPKYKNIGDSAKFIYPFYAGKEIHNDIQESILDLKEINLLESPSDMLACYDEGVKNLMVFFGLNLSKAVMGKMVECDPNVINICLNNDVRGWYGCIRTIYSLTEFFDGDQIFVKLPPENDLSDSKNQIKKWKNDPSLTITCFLNKYWPLIEEYSIKFPQKLKIPAYLSKFVVKQLKK